MMAHGESITVTTRTQSGTDAYGNPTYVTTSLTRRGAFSPSGGVELTGAGDLVTSTPQVLFTRQAAVDIAAVATSDSQVTVRGGVYTVDGEPGDWVSPFTGRRAGLLIPLKRSTGTA